MSVQKTNLPVGTEFVGSDVRFRVWAPLRREVTLMLGGAERPMRSNSMDQAGGGYWEVVLSGVREGDRYAFRLDADPIEYPDPASRSQPDGPHGRSEVVDPRQFRWTDQEWAGIGPAGQVLYELHVGTFSRAGTWRGAIEQLPDLKDLGVTCIEVMPIAEFPGRFGWGYDGVSLFAPSRLYGRPDDFRQFVDTAHRLGLGVILDVVYNHLGPDGNYLRAFSPGYFTDRYKTDWGEPLHFDSDGSGPVREFYIANAVHWIREYHLDGFRFDATQNIYDFSPRHILRDIGEAAREAASPRTILLAGENEEQQVRYVTPTEHDGYGFDSLWNDDFHHSSFVALTGQAEAYYSDYRGTPQEFISAFKRGFLFQGQLSSWQKKRRGSAALKIPPTCFISYLENHDQVANSAAGLRRHAVTQPAQYRAVTAAWLLAPMTPLLFQGQEFAASAPFLYFADHHAELAAMVRAGRGQFLSQFPSLASPEMQANLPDPANPDTFERSRLDWTEREKPTHSSTLALHRDLLALRRSDRVVSRQSQSLDGAVLGEQAFLIRYFADDNLDRLLLVNLGQDLRISPLPEPLLAEPDGAMWELCWCSESPAYGGTGVPQMQLDDGWFLPKHSAAFFSAIPAAASSDRRTVAEGTNQKEIR